MTVLLGNMFVNVLYCSLAVLYAARLAGEHGRVYFYLADAASLVLLIIAGEVVPKSVAVNLPLPVARLSSPLLLAFKTVILPVRAVFDALVKALTAIIPGRSEDTAVTGEDLSNLLEIGGEHGLLTPREKRMLIEVIEFAVIEAREVMTPRVAVALCDVGKGRENALKLIGESKHSKIPVWRDNPDNIVGVIHSKDVFLYPEKPFDSLVRPVPFFPETAIETSL